MVKSRKVIGIDPGLYGALAYIGNHSVDIVDAPQVNKEWDYQRMLGLLKLGVEQGWEDVCIEKVRGFPTDGGARAFNFGFGFGCWIMACNAVGLRVHQVLPVTWKKFFNLLGRNKSASIKEALERFPKCEKFLGRLKDDGRAEALLIGQWWRDVGQFEG